MTGYGDRLHDVRQRPTFHVERAAVAFIPHIGPAAWAVYCYLLAHASSGDSAWPDELTIASGCGISTYNARVSIDTLISHGLIARHQWTDEAGGPATFAVMPVSGGPDAEAPHLGVRHSAGTDRLVAEDPSDEERWQAETRERNETRELFSRFLDALGVDPGDLSEQARTTVTEASRLARAVGATPDDVESMIDAMRQEHPDLVLDAERMLDYWNQLFRELDDETRNDGESD